MKKSGEKISMLTAYDFTFAKILDEAGIDIILVGDSASNVFAGNETTVPITLDEMIYHATANEYDFPYVMDEDAKLAKAFGAMKTPHVYLFDANDRLVYTGAIDDNAKSAKRVKKNYLMDALSSLGNGKNIATRKTKALGCSIKFN